MHFLKKEIFFYVFFAIFVIESIAFVCFLKVDFTRCFLASINPDFLWELTNKDREALGIGALEKNKILEEAAFMKASHMAENSYFAHTSPEGITPWYWFKKAGYEFSHAGENLAVNFSDSRKLHQAWINSPGHKANIMSNNFTHIGIATAKGEYKGREATFVVQLFGREKQTEAFLIEQEIISLEESADVLGAEISLEEADKYESFVAVAKDEEDIISPIISSSLTERKELKYTPFLSSISSLLGGEAVYFLLFSIGIIAIAGLAIKAFLRKRIRLYQAVVNGILIFLVALSALLLNSLLATMVNTNMQFF